MRLGAPLFKPFANAEEWAAVVRGYGYSAAFCPLGTDADAATVREYAEAARRHDIVIGEVGAWSNPIDQDPAVAREAMQRCVAGLRLADQIGARCCVNIAGSKGPRWDGPSPLNLGEKCFEQIVQTVREIIDAANPQQSYYTLETMPWIFPHTPHAYLELIEAIERPHFAVHLDPVNMVNGVMPYYETTALLRRSFRKLGPHIRSCHAKDILLQDRLTVHLDEVRPGLGNLDYRTYLEELSRLEPDVCLLIEHLPNEEEYLLAGEYIRGIAEEIGVAFL